MGTGFKPARADSRVQTVPAENQRCDTALAAC